MSSAGLLSVVSVLMVWAMGSGAPPTRTPTATGHLHLTFSERSPLSAVEVVLARMGYVYPAPNVIANLEYDLAQLSFEVFVPPTYRPEVPHGLFVWMGVTEVPPVWLNALARHKLILLVANTRRGRVALYGPPLDAVHNMKKRYNIDENRVYASGFSAGGSMAAMMVRGFPEVFRGGLFLMGGYFYLSYVGEGGRREPTIEGSHPPWKGSLDQIKKEAKLVIMKAANDPQWMAAEGRCDEEALRLDGFTHVSYFEVPRLGHYPPDAAWFEKGVAALDQSPALTPPVTAPTQDPRPQPGQMAQAQRILAAARYYLEMKPPQGSEETKERARRSNREKARQYLQRVLEEYPTTPAAARARKLLQGMEQTP
jgi:dienelactone hydrolase